MTQRQLSESDYDWIHETFVIFDTNRDNCITKTELRLGLQQLGQNPTCQDVDDLMDELGIKGTIHFADYERCMSVMMSGENKDRFNNEDDLLESFKVFDKDENGYIDKDELAKALTELGEKFSKDEVDEMFRAADTNNDGKIVYKEFIQMMKDGP